MVIDRFVASWEKRAAVKKNLVDTEIGYEIGVPDFPVQLVPFKHVSGFSEIDQGVLNRLLGAGWLLYNDKTTRIEEMIVNPGCYLLRAGPFSNMICEAERRVLSQTMVDEQYHAHMCLSACLSTIRRHRLEGLRLPYPLVVGKLSEHRAKAASDFDRSLVQLAFMTVAELTINPYLQKLSSDMTIQPTNRELTEIHRCDELTHATIIQKVMKSVFTSLQPEKKELFLGFLQGALTAFSEQDAEPWHEIAKFLGIEHIAAQRWVGDCVDDPKPAGREFTQLLTLLAEFGIKDHINLPTWG